MAYDAINVNKKGLRPVLPEAVLYSMMGKEHYPSYKRKDFEEVKIQRNLFVCCLIAVTCIFLAGCTEEPVESGQPVATEEKAETVETELPASAEAELPKEQVSEEMGKAQEKEEKIKEEKIKEEKIKEEQTDESLLPPLQVEGTQLVDAEGNPVQLRGLSTHGLSWFPQYVNQELFNELATEWNSNVVRLAMYSAEYDGYCTGGNQEELKRLIRDGVQYAENAGMYVIIDWHVLGEGDPNIYKEEAKLFFDEMSKEFCDKQHVIYEICNEPNGGVTWSSVKSYALEVIPVIRANDEDAVIIVGTPTWSQDVDKAAADPITEYDNIMYALHFYAATHKEDLRNRMVNALEDGLPIIVSEYGICSADGSGGIDEVQAQAWIDLMDEKNVSYIAWNLSNKTETSAVFASNCNKTNGFTTEELSEGGRWLYHMLSGGAQPESKAGSDKNTSQSEEVQAEAPKEVSKAEDSPEYTALLTGSWEAENKKYEQYSVTVYNTSDNEFTDWKLEIAFDSEITLSDAWNGKYTVKENLLEITNADYNGAIAPQGEVRDIGFIICYSDSKN